MNTLESVANLQISARINAENLSPLNLEIQ